MIYTIHIEIWRHYLHTRLQREDEGNMFAGKKEREREMWHQEKEQPSGNIPLSLVLCLRCLRLGSGAGKGMGGRKAIPLFFLFDLRHTRDQFAVFINSPQVVSVFFT